MSGDSRRKRAASEPVEVLVASDDETHALSSARPLATTLGSLFVFGRGIAGLFWIGAFLLAWPALADEEHVAADERPFVFWLVLSIGVLAALTSLVFAWSIWRGSNLARVLVMCGVTLSTITAASSYFANGEQITIQTTLLTVSLDILVLLALSSRDARAWARQPRSASARRTNVKRSRKA